MLILDKKIYKIRKNISIILMLCLIIGALIASFSKIWALIPMWIAWLIYRKINL